MPHGNRESNGVGSPKSKKTREEPAMLHSFFARQLAIYASYHRDARNRATHFIGIPAIVFSILVPLALARMDSIGASWAMIIAALAVLGWITLDAVTGMA